MDKNLKFVVNNNFCKEMVSIILWKYTGVYANKSQANIA